MPLILRPHSRFKRQLKKLRRSGNKRYLLALDAVINIITAGGKPIPMLYLDHALAGKFDGLRECHIAPDWLLIYYISIEEQAVYLVATGTHSELFK